ncbi:MAG: PAS domain S-box protein, partial [Methanoregula sp.]|nr:PAS domain S-box protein [Methanoregula sp.]
RARGDKTPFILFTGKGREEVVIEALNSGADFYLQKGGDPGAQFAELSHKIRQAAARKMAEDSLRKSEKRHRTILQTTMDGFWIVDAKGNVTDVNETYCRMSGYTRKELLKLHITALDAVEAPVETAERIRRIKANGSEIFETRHRRKVSSVFDVEVSTTYLNADGGRIICFCRDITGRKQAERALVESEANYRLLADNGNDTIWILGFDGMFTYHSPAVMKLRGYTPSEANAISIEQTLCPESLSVIEKMFSEESEKPMRERWSDRVLELQIFRKDGSAIWIEAAVRAIRDKEGNITGLLGNARDITERKLAGEALNESERRFRELSDMLPQIVYETDANGMLTYANRIAFEWFGYTEEEFRQGLNLLQMLAPDDRERGGAAFRAILEGKGRIGIPDEYRAQKKDGSTFPITVYHSPVIVQGRITGLRGIIIDITERKLAEQMLQESEPVTVFSSLHLMDSLSISMMQRLRCSGMIIGRKCLKYQSPPSMHTLKIGPCF